MPEPTFINDRYVRTAAMLAMIRRVLLRMLLATIGRELADRFDQGVLFVERANEKSLAVHRHLGMTATGEFSFAGRRYVVLSFDPAVASTLA